MILTRYEGGRKFRRSIFGYRSEARADAVAKALWRMNHAVRVEKGRWRWHVWRSV